MHRAALSLIVATIAIAAPGFAQERPDFSGIWTLAADAPPAPDGKTAAAPGFGPTINIRQDATSITVSRLMGGQIVPVTHTLDGIETRSRTPGRLCEGDAQSVWTAAWQGNDILITLAGSLAPGASTVTKMDVRTTLKLAQARAAPSVQAHATMTVEVTFRNPNMKEPRTVTTIYERTGPPVEPTEAAVTPLAARIGQVEWLAGTWIGTTGTSGFEERWTPPAGGSMLAVARTLRGGVMAGFEFLCIVERNGGLVYQAMPNGRQPATDFTLTRIDRNGLTFENPAHDFPKTIRYTLSPDGILEAVVSGTEKQKPQTFRFTRQ